MTRTYDYSPIHRMVEVFSILALAVAVGLLAFEASAGLRGTPYAVWWLPATALLGFLAADFVSGVVHFLGDTFGNEEWPAYVGPSFIRPFREHHVDPRAITRHDFIETNGNNCLVCWPTAFGSYFLLPARDEVWAAGAALFVAWFMVWIFMTNQFHKWAHLEEPPAWIARLQAWNLILEPGHHDRHHTPPFDTYYCITSGWLNPVLHHTRFFPILEATLRWIFRAPRQEERAPTVAGPR